MYLCNHFRYNEELNGHAKVKSKLTKIYSTPRLTIVYRKYPCEPALHKLTKKIDELDRKTPQNDKLLTKTFWSYSFYIAALSSLPAPIVIRKAIMTTTSHALDLVT